uniref:Uncharacterized protein n=1 Tax=Glossina palpalis gambiensis TaxID=67801 RepID=A0A1B0C0L5_9MUSC
MLWSHCRNEFKTLSHDVISNSPTHCRGNNGDYSPNIQNIWPFSSSLPDDVPSTEFSHINSERYRSLLSGLQFQSFTPQQHQSLLNQQQRPTSLQHYSPQQQEIRSNSTSGSIMKESRVVFFDIQGHKCRVFRFFIHTDPSSIYWKIAM